MASPLIRPQPAAHGTELWSTLRILAGKLERGVGGMGGWQGGGGGGGKRKTGNAVILILPALVFVLASTRQVVNGEERAVGVMEAV